MENVEDIYPLSPMQEGILFHAVAEPGSGVFVDQVSSHLSGDLNGAQFKVAWATVLDRHPALRSIFPWDGLDEPLQVVRRHAEIEWIEDDWRSFSPQQREGRLAAFLEEDRARGFDPATAPLTRMALFRVDTDRWRWVWTFHHLISDGWSTPILLEEVFAIYAARSKGDRAELQAAFPYRAFIAWQAEQDLGSAEAFWRSALLDFETPTRLRAWSPGETAGGTGYGQVSSRMSQRATSALREFAKANRLTLSSVIQGAWALLLAAYSGEQDLVFGVTTSGRPSELTGVDRAVGLFINTLPLRARLEPQVALVEFLKGLQADHLDIRRREFTPLAAVQRWSDVPAGEALFDTILVFENYPQADSLVPEGVGLEIEDLAFHEQSNYPLAALIIPGEQLEIILVHDRSMLDESTVSGLLEHLETLLEAFPNRGSNTLREVPLLTEDEHARLLVDWNDTSHDGPEPLHVHQLIDRAAAERPDSTAVQFGVDRIRYADLAARTNAMARALRSRGVSRGIRVGLRVERSIEMVLGMLAVLKAGGTYVPIDPSYPEAQALFILEDSETQVLLTQRHWVAGRSLADELPVDTRLFLDDREWWAGESSAPTDIETDGGDIAYVMYTSGSTGKPKGVRVSHRNLAHSTTVRDAVYPAPSQRFLLLSSFAFDSSVVGIYWSLCTGGTLVLPAPSQEQDLESLLEIIRADRVTHLLCLPALYDLLLSEGASRDLQSLQVAIVAGEACPRHVAARHHRTLPEVLLFNEYGPTEATVWSTVHQVENQPPDEPVPIGRPIPNTRAYVLDALQRPVPVGVFGELYLAGEGVAPGYLNRPRLQDERFLSLDIEGIREPHLYRTGDVVCHRPDGCLLFAGRADSQVKIRGHRIETEGIEGVLRQHPDIAEAIVRTDRQQVTGRDRLVAFLVFDTTTPAESTDDETVVRSFLEERLPDFMVPERFVVLEQLPRTANGKVDLAALPDPSASDEALSPTQLSPINHVEETLCDIWAQLLGVPSVGRSENFFEIGGDSILTIQMVSRARQAGLRLEPGWVAAHPTVAELAALSEAEVGPVTEHEVVVGDVPLLPIQRWFFERQMPQPHHWNQSVLLEVPADLDVEALRDALGDCLRHHDMLRARYVETTDGEWIQSVTRSDQFEAALSVVDIDSSGLPDQDLLDLQQGLQLTEGPLLRAGLFRFASDQSSSLLLAAHHLVVDAVSWTVLLEDLERAYLARRDGESTELPARTASFRAWAEQMQRLADSAILREELAHWESLIAFSSEGLPRDSSPAEIPTEAAARVLTVILDAEKTRALLVDANESYRTSPQELLIAAVVLALTRWTGRSEQLLAIERHGRTADGVEMDLSRTVGWFTSSHPAGFSVPDPLDLEAAIRMVKNEVHRVPNHGIGFGVLRYLGGDSAVRERLAAIPKPQVLFNYLGKVTSDSGGRVFQRRAGADASARSSLNPRSHLIEINARIEADQLQTDWIYCETIHRRGTMETVANGFLEALSELVSHCLSPGAGALTASDFPDADLEADELNELIDRLD